MALPTSSIAKICDTVREYVDTLGQDPGPADWDVNVTIGAPGINHAAATEKNTINLFFYRFEPFGFNADVLPSEVQYIRVLCFITAFGVDEEISGDDEIEFSAGFNELRMISQVMRLFHERPIMLMSGDDSDELWHTQFIHKPLADEQISQIWSSQGDAVYRPSVVYEIALAPVEPQLESNSPPRVASFGTDASSNMLQRYKSWPTNRDMRYPQPSTISIDVSNPQWTPAIVFVTGLAAEREADLSLNVAVPVTGSDLADFSAFPEIDIWLAGDTSTTNDLTLVGQLLQNSEPDRSAGNWHDIDAVTGLSADVSALDIGDLPLPSPDASAVSFTLNLSHWTGINDTMNNWQIQLFIERNLKFDSINNTWVDVVAENAELRIRSNPLLITVTRESS